MARARGRERRDSDYDFAVLDYSHPLTAEEETSLHCELFVLFKTDAVDLVMLRRTKPLLQFNAAREGVTVYEREPGLHRRYHWRPVKLWDDSRKFLQRKGRRVERFLEKAGLR